VSGLRDYDKWANSLRNYDWIKDAVPGATDVDALIERNGKFLVIEAKHRYGDGGVIVPLGQHIALAALARRPDFTVWLIGEPSEISAGEWFSLHQYGTFSGIHLGNHNGRLFPADRFRALSLDALRDEVRSWWVNAGVLPT
jgi:hypothetical protein